MAKQQFSWESLSGWAGIVGIPSSIYGFSSQAPPTIAYPIWGVTAGVFSVWIYFKLKQSPKQTNIIGEGEETAEELDKIKQSAVGLRDDFELIENITTIDIHDSSGDLATVQQTNSVKCLKNSTNKYYFRFAPINFGSSFKIISPRGCDLFISENMGGTDLDVILNKRYLAGDRLNIVLSLTCKKAFTAKKEFWVHRRIYKGSKENNVKIIVKFPSDRYPEKWDATYFFNNDTGNKKPIEKLPQFSILENRPTLWIETDEVPQDHNIVLEWEW